MKRRAVLLALAALILGGCASMRKIDVGTADNSGYRVDVYNSRSTSLTVSYTDQSGDHELGTVSAGQTGHFVIPGSSGKTITLMGMTSSGGHYTKPVTLGTTTKVTL